MHRRLPLMRALVAAVLACLLAGVAAGARAQWSDAVAPPPPRPAADGSYQPRVGQEGKDVIWVPTPPALVTRMLQLAQTTSRDFVVDLGSGDGRIPIAAVKQFGAHALGIEYNPDLVVLSLRLAREAGVAGRAQMVQGDIFEKDFSRATVVTTYLLPELNARLRPTLLAMSPGTRVVAHLFGMGDWPPDETSYVGGRPAFLWIVPAHVAGRWRFEVASGAGEPGHVFSADLDQQFQKVSGVVTFGPGDASALPAASGLTTTHAAGGMTTTLVNPQLRGDAFHFAVTDVDGVVRVYRGRVDGTVMSGIAEVRRMASDRNASGRGVARLLRWQAVRIGDSPAPN